jgi:hypothetical protein
MRSQLEKKKHKTEMVGKTDGMGWEMGEWQSPEVIEPQRAQTRRRRVKDAEGKRKRRKYKIKNKE